MEFDGAIQTSPIKNNVFVEYVAMQHLFPGCEYPVQAHRTAELFIFLSGSMTVAVQNETMTVKEGEYFLKFPGLLFSAVAEEGPVCSLLQLRLTLRPNLQTGYVHRSCPEQLRACVRGIYEEYPGIKQASSELLQHYLCQLKLLLTRELEQSRVREDRPINPHLLRACSYIHEHCCSHLTVTEIAENGGISARYLRKLFSEYLHKSVCEYIMEARVQKSLELLEKNADYPLARLALDVGFSSQQHFSAVFKEVMSVSPKRYLDQRKNSEIGSLFLNL